MKRIDVLKILNDCSDKITFPDETTEKVILFKEDGYDELAERLVELFSIAFVTQKSEPLVAFMKYYKNNVPIGTQKSSVEIVKDYLATIELKLDQVQNFEELAEVISAPNLGGMNKLGQSK